MLGLWKLFGHPKCYFLYTKMGTFAKSVHLYISKMALLVPKRNFWDSFYKPNIPKKLWNCLLFKTFSRKQIQTLVILVTPYSGTVNMSLAVVLSNVWAMYEQMPNNALNTNSAWICQAGWKVWKSAKYFLLSYLCSQIAHSTVVHRCRTFAFFGGQPPLLLPVMALIRRPSLGNLKQVKGR